MDGDSCGSFTAESILSLVIKGLCRNQGRLGFLACDVYSRTLAEPLLANTAIGCGHEDSLLSLDALF